MKFAVNISRAGIVNVVIASPLWVGAYFMSLLVVKFPTSVRDAVTDVEQGHILSGGAFGFLWFVAGFFWLTIFLFAFYGHWFVVANHTGERIVRRLF